MKTVLLFLFLLVPVVFIAQQSASPVSAKATILFDAFSKNKDLSKAWGYSALVEYNGKIILFDAGSNADTFKMNVEKLKIDLRKLDAVVVSHAHYDHLNGIDYVLSVNPKVKIYFPADIFWGAETIFNAKGQDTLVKNSLPQELRYFDGKGDVFKVEQSGGRFWHANIEFVKNNREIFPGVTLIATSANYMGYFSRYPSNFTQGQFNEVKDDTRFTNLPELSLSLKGSKGQSLFVGCSHTGVESIAEAALKQTAAPINMLLGGFHLLPFNQEQISGVINKLHDSLHVKQVAPGHCTGHLAFKLLMEKFQENFIYAGLGTKLDL